MDSDVNLASESDARPEETTQKTETPAEGDQPSPAEPESDGDQAAEVEPSTPSDEAAAAAEASDDDGDSAAAKPEQDKGETAQQRDRRRKRQSAKQRIDQLTQEKRNLEAELARTRDQLAQQSASKKPDRDDFDDEADFQVAVTEYAIDQREAKRNQETAKRTEANAADKRNEIFLERVDAVRDRMPDFDQVFHDKLPITEAMADVIAESDKGPEIAYYLGKNQTELREIANMPPIQAARALGQLEGRLTRSRAKRRSTAPAPPKTLSGAADSEAPSLEEMSYEEYRKARGYEPQVK